MNHILFPPYHYIGKQLNGEKEMKTKLFEIDLIDRFSSHDVFWLYYFKPLVVCAGLTFAIISLSLLIIMLLT